MSEPKKEEVIRRVPVSGRWWKGVEKSRHSMKFKKPSKLTKSWKRKMEERKKRKEIKQLENEVNALREEKKEKERVKRENKRKRKAAADMMNTRYQVITNADKIKKMSRKQLRKIKKAKVDNEGNVKFVGIYE